MRMKRAEYVIYITVTKGKADLLPKKQARPYS